MNGTIIHELYNGGIYPFESIVPTDPNYRPLEQKINEEREVLKEKLSKEDGERMDDLSDLYRESSTMYGYANFSHGFKLGALLMCEILGSEDKPGA